MFTVSFRSVMCVVAGMMVVCGQTKIAKADATVFRGTHIGFDTATGTPGEQLLLKTGYGTSGAPESEQWAFRFQNGTAGGQLQTRSDRYVNNPNPSWDIARYNLHFTAPNTMVAGECGGVSPVNGWYAQSSITSNAITERQTFNATAADSFVSAGRLVGGNFAWEIMGVQALNGSPAASFAMGLMTNPAGFTNDSQRLLQTVETETGSSLDVFGVYDAGQLGGGSLADRSLNVGYGNHFHGWGFFVSQAGEYEVTMRVYDKTGTYGASEAFSFVMNSVPTSGMAGVFGIGAISAMKRRRK